MRFIIPTLFSFTLWIFPNATLQSQDLAQIPTVNFTQGKIIGDLPYGQHFYIFGSASLPGGNKAEKVEVEIWRTGREAPPRKKKLLSELTPAQMENIKKDPGNLVNYSSWHEYRADDSDNFKVYINATLRFQKEYLVEFSYYRVFNMELTLEERDAILKKVTERSVNTFNRKSEITNVDVEEILEEETARIIYQKLNLKNETFFNREQIEENLPVVEASSLEALAEVIPGIAADQTLVEKRKAQVRELQAEIASASEEDSQDLKDALNQRKEQLEKAEALLVKSMADNDLPAKLAVIRQQMIMVGKEYTISTPNATSIPSLDAVRVGTTFGGGAVGLNVPSEQRDYDTFGYTALKYHFAPVDKRIVEPYLTDKWLLSRLSLMVGVSTKDDFNYRGDNLQKAFAFTPLLGLSIDVNRFFTIDLGATTFKQSSLSPLSNDENTRVGPILGINLDADLFNRVSSIVSGDKYRISPAPNK